MRSIFTIAIAQKSGDNKFLTNEEFLSFIRAGGWDDPKILDIQNENDRLARYNEIAESSWSHMPEVANDEKDHIIFCGTMQNNQTKFVITRANLGYAKFRLINPNLDRLQESTEQMIKFLVNPLNEESKKPKFTIERQRVEILEKNEIHEIIEGRVIYNAFKEAKARNSKNYLLAIATFILFLLSLAAIISLRLCGIPHDNLWVNMSERINTVSLTTCAVSAYDFYATYKSIKDNNIVAWTVSTEIARKGKELIK